MQNAPAKYRKKPVAIDAMQLIGSAGETVKVTAWMNDHGYPWLVGDASHPDTLRQHLQPADDDSKPTKGIYIDPASGDLMIRTLEGDMRARYGDYIIKGVEGEFYPCALAIFEKTYELV